MSRIANKPIAIPNGVSITAQGQAINVKGSKGQLSFNVHDTVKIVINSADIVIEFDRENPVSKMHAGTARANIANMVQGVSKGFEKKLTLVGVGYRAKAQGSTLNLTLGFSHPIDHVIPAGVTVETPSQTEIILKGMDVAVLGQVAADIRSYRPPEPYKGKGVRYFDEQIKLKETKKK
jgi:large subunit ribosomal protein L6